MARSPCATATATRSRAATSAPTSPARPNSETVGSAFYLAALDFDRAGAAATGADDTARLFDSALDDVYWSRPDHSRMEYPDGTFVEALDFRYNYGYSRYGTDAAAKGRFSNERRAIYLDDFLTLTAITSEVFGDEADVDEAYVDQVILVGDWTDLP